MNKEQFIEYIEMIENIFISLDQFSEDASKLFPNAFEANLYPSFSNHTDDLVKWIQKIMEDSSDWIGYYIYELNFGKNYEEGMISSPEGKPINLKTIEDLWNILQNKQ